MSVIDLEPLICLKRARMDVERGNCEYNVTDYLDTIEAALLELKSIKEASSSEALECLKQIEDVIETKIGLGVVNTYLINIIKKTLIKAQEQEMALKELIANHIEFVVEKDRCYFKIKDSKGKEKSFTSYSMLDFWKEALE